MPNAEPPLSNGATDLTASINAAVTVPDWSTDPEVQNAQQGQILVAPTTPIRKDLKSDGRVVWDLSAYDFLFEREDVPETCNPSLWRNAKINMYAGVFTIVENAVYQVRGLDLSNITFLEDIHDTKALGQIVVVDPLVSAECAATALELYYSVRPRRPIGAVIYTHSHLDHYGGVEGLFQSQSKDGVHFYAPDGFLDHAVDENVFAGEAMGRRAEFMYGIVLPRGERGQVDAGLGKATSTGTSGIIGPDKTIKADPEHPDRPVPQVICNIKFEFQLTPKPMVISSVAAILPPTPGMEVRSWGKRVGLQQGGQAVLDRVALSAGSRLGAAAAANRTGPAVPAPPDAGCAGPGLVPGSGGPARAGRAA